MKRIYEYKCVNKENQKEIFAEISFLSLYDEYCNVLLESERTGKVVEDVIRHWNNTYTKFHYEIIREKNQFTFD